MTDLNEHPHYMLLQSESYVSQEERRWLAWVAKVEAILGHPLDGDQKTDGYSLDFANDAFADGLTPREYAEEVRS